MFSLKKYISPQISVWIQESIFLLACFFYMFFHVHPVLMIESQSPVFLMTSDFLKEFLLVPGGLTDWLSALVMQCWFSDLIISLMLTACFWFVIFLTKVWMGTLIMKRPLHSFHLIPAGLLLVFHSQFDFHFSIAVALMINLFVLTLFLRLAPKNQIVRAFLGIVISFLLYWITGGAFYLFVVLYGFDELIRKRFVSSILILCISGILPFIASRFIVLIPLKQAYLHNLSFEFPLEVWYTGYLLPAFFLVTCILASLTRYFQTWRFFRNVDRIALLWKLAAGTILVIGGTILLSAKSINDIKRQVLLVDRAVVEERWSDVLSLTKYCTNENPLIISQSNLALFQTGHLLDSMFAYPQPKGALSLMMNQTWSLAWPENVSNIYWRLGLINESQHWAHEALEHKGPTPDLLKRLGMIYMLKGENDAANHFFLNLKNVPFQGRTADDLIRLNENPSELRQDSTCNYIQSCMPVEDLISTEKIFPFELELLLKKNPKNKMAFEYLIAYHLLNANGKGVWDRIPDFKALNYAKIPRHVQEIMIVIAAMNPKFDLNKLKPWIDPKIFNRFVEYRNTALKHKDDKSGGKQELQARFGDTYWYYLMFVKAAPRQSESHNEYQ